MNKKKCSPGEIAGEAVKWLPQIKKLRKNRGEEKEFAKKRKGAGGVKTEQQQQQLVLYNYCSV